MLEVRHLLFFYNKLGEIVLFSVLLFLDKMQMCILYLIKVSLACIKISLTGTDVLNIMRHTHRPLHELHLATTWRDRFNKVQEIFLGYLGNMLT